MRHTPQITRAARHGMSQRAESLSSWLVFWSGRRDSNPRPRPWQGRALPLSYTRVRGPAEVAPDRRRAMPKGAALCNRFTRRAFQATDLCGSCGTHLRGQLNRGTTGRCVSGHAARRQTEERATMAPTTPPASPRMPLGTDYILHALAEEGLTHLFMVPGGLVDPFLPALARQDRLMPVVAAHEGGAVYMADGYARARGSFGAALGIGGPGCGNMATAIAAAKTDGSPLLVMTGEVPIEMQGRGEFQDASQATLDDTAVMGPLTRLSKTVLGTKNLNHWFRHALTTMWAQPRGPVHLSLAHDALIGESAVNYVKVHPFFVGTEPLSLAPADAAVAALADAQRENPRIAVLAGAGVEHGTAAALLKMLAERWSLPVATTLRAKGVFPEDHALSLGVFGYAGTRHATNAILDDALGCLLVLGSGLNERDTMHWTVRERSKASMIHINIDMDELTANGDLGHVVPASTHAFLDLMDRRADLIGPPLQRTGAPAAMARHHQGGAAA